MSLPTLDVDFETGGFLRGAQLDNTTTANLDTAILATGVPLWDQDITHYVRGFSTNRGAARETDRTEAGTATILLDNRDGRFTPFLSSSPYFPSVLPMRRIRIQAITTEVPETISGLVAWYDFSDLSTLFQDTARTSPVTADGQTIKAVADKSGHGYHMTEATNGPLYKAAIQNGQSVMRSDGTNDQLTISATTSITNSTLFVVFKILTLTNNKGVVSIYDTTPAGNNSDFNSADMFGISHSATANNARYNTLGSDALNYTADMGDYVTTFAIASTTITTADNTLNIWRNGSVIVASGTAEARVASDGGIIAGCRWEAGAPIGFGNDDIGDILLYNSVLSAANHNLVGQYLANKWGLSWTTVT